MNVAKSIVPAVCVYVVHTSAAANVVVPAPLLTTNGPSVVLAFGVIVPVPRIVAVNAVNTPLGDKVNPFKFNAVTAGVHVEPLKFNVLNQLPVVKVGIAAPLGSDKFGLLVVDPPVVPNVKVLVTDIALVKPPVPV